MVQRVLLTSAASGLGMHILSQLLSANFFVRAIVPSQRKADRIRSEYPTAHQNLDFGIVPDLDARGAFDHVIKSDPSIDLVIYTPHENKHIHSCDNLECFLVPAKRGTEEFWGAIKANAEGVTRVVMTSDFDAMIDYDAGNNGKRYTADDWNPTTWEEAEEGDEETGYAASKKFAELAAWEFMEQEKPKFELVTLCPPMIYGPQASRVSGPTILIAHNALIHEFLFKFSSNAELPPNRLYLYVDVRDLATAHVRAATVPEAANKRFIVSKGQLGSQEISDILRKNFPELEKRTPKGTPGTSSLPENANTADSSPAENVLGIQFRSPEETIVDLGKVLLENELKRLMSELVLGGRVGAWGFRR